MSVLNTDVSSKNTFLIPDLEKNFIVFSPLSIVTSWKALPLIHSAHHHIVRHKNPTSNICIINEGRFFPLKITH